MYVERFEVRELDMPLVTPFRTSQSFERSRRGLLVRVITDSGEGWADLTAEDGPHFSHEFIAGTWVSLQRVLLPSLGIGDVTAPQVAVRLASVVGHPYAKSALEMAVLDAELRAASMSLSTYLGGTARAVAVGVSVGITDTMGELTALVDGYVAEGYSRIKLKIQPGWDLDPVREVRAAIGDGIELQVDGNGAYRSSDVSLLASLEQADLAMIEQPFPADDLRSHTRLAASTSVPVCLDESIGSARDAVTAVEAGACDVINIKAARVGGYLEARRIHDVCQALGVPVWCGGMLESGVGRAANLALASLPNFQYAGDISATSRYFIRDITAPFVLDNGTLPVPTGPGVGVDVDLNALDQFTQRRETYGPDDLQGLE